MMGEISILNGTTQFDSKGWVRMNGTDWAPYVFYFAVYAFAGWLLENSYSAWTGGHFWKDGFLLGPHKPMYGITPVILLLMAASGVPLWGMLAGCLLVPSLVELLTGYLLDTRFHLRYWDYSGNRLQVGGHICLQFSLYWFGLCLVCLYVLQPGVEQLYRAMAPVWTALAPCFLLYLLIDFLVTAARARPSAQEG